MKAVNKLAIGAVGIAALVGVSAPAAAQYYPGYPAYGGGYNQPANVIGQVLQTVLNPYGARQSYGVNPQMATQQCAAAVQQRLARSYRTPYGYGYNNYAPSQARVMQVTRIEQRSRSVVRVRGTATSGMAQNNYGPYGYGAYGSVGYGYAQPADLTFKCDVDYRGRIRDIDINRRY